MSKRRFPLAGVSSTALVLMLTGCAASLPNSQSSAPPTTAPDTVAALQAHQPEVVSQAQQADASEPTIAAAPTPADVVESAAAKATAKAPEPTRTPASVLRLWVAPWEDADGNLHGASHVYTEVLPRRWQLDGANLPAAGVLQPLQVVERTTLAADR